MNYTLNKLLPEIAFDALSLFKSSNKWTGNYATWEEAEKKAVGYDSDFIISKVSGAAREIINGNGIFERDSIVFHKAEYSWPLLSTLLWIGAQKSKLHLLDFGGSLGSTYHQHKKYLSVFEDIKWMIVEQPKFVEEGKKYFENETIQFYDTIDTCLLENSPSVVLISSVLQYIEDPYELIETIGQKKIEYVIIDLTGISSSPTDIITLQKVDPNIYPASYPCRFFNEAHLKEAFSKHFHIIDEFDSYIGNKLKINTFKPAKYRGYILKNKSYGNY